MNSESKELSFETKSLIGKWKSLVKKSEKSLQDNNTTTINKSDLNSLFLKEKNLEKNNFSCIKLEIKTKFSNSPLRLNTIIKFIDHFHNLYKKHEYLIADDFKNSSKESISENCTDTYSDLYDNKIKLISEELENGNHSILTKLYSIKIKIKKNI